MEEGIARQELKSPLKEEWLDSRPAAKEGGLEDGLVYLMFFPSSSSPPSSNVWDDWENSWGSWPKLQGGGALKSDLIHWHMKECRRGELGEDWVRLVNLQVSVQVNDQLEMGGLKVSDACLLLQ